MADFIDQVNMLRLTGRIPAHQGHSDKACNSTSYLYHLKTKQKQQQQLGLYLKCISPVYNVPSDCSEAAELVRLSAFIFRQLSHWSSILNGGGADENYNTKKGFQLSLSFWYDIISVHDELFEPASKHINKHYTIITNSAVFLFLF